MTISACGPQAITAPTSRPAAATPAVSDTPAPAAVSTEAPEPSAARQQYANRAFGLGFQFPSSWYGPDETISDQTLRVAVGSDVVYPYGEPPEQPSPVKNSYLIVIQYSQDNQNSYWQDTFQTLAGLQDGESISGNRGKIIRVRQLDLGRFKGFEYISTLSETAQTEPVYGREVILVDDQSKSAVHFWHAEQCRGRRRNAVAAGLSNDR